MELNFEKYDALKVLEKNMKACDLQIIEFVNQAIHGNFSECQLTNIDGKSYVIIPTPMVKRILNLSISEDNCYGRIRLLADKGLLSIKIGKWNDSRYGYTRTSLSLGDQFDSILR